MKMQSLNQNYVVLSQEPGTSGITGKPYVKITLVGTRDRDEYITYIDSSNHNHANWQHVTSNPEHGFILSNLNVKKHKDRLLIDADSKPVITEDISKERILEALQSVWAEQDAKSKDKFKDLFE